MSRFKIFDNIRDRVADWWDRSIAFRYHIPGLEIGTSKEHSLLEYKSDLNDPEFWQAVPTETKPETGGQQIYGTGTWKEFTEEVNRLRSGSKDLGIVGANGEAIIPEKRILIRDYNQRSLQGVSTKTIVEPTASIDVRKHRRAVNSKVRIRDLEDLGVSAEQAGSRFDVQQHVTGSKFDFDSTGSGRKPYNNLAVTETRVGRTGSTATEERKGVVKTFGSPITSASVFGGTTDKPSYLSRKRGSSIVPSWIKNAIDEKQPEKNRSAVSLAESTVSSKRITAVSSTSTSVKSLSKLYPDNALIPRQYYQDQLWATGSEKIVNEVASGSYGERDTVKSELSLSKHRRGKIDTEHGVANSFYGKPGVYSGSFYLPGGTTDKKLEYDLDLVNKELGLIPFCITTLTPDYRTYLNFPAHLDSYEDNYTGEWDSVQYIGRAEKFHGYTGFSRNLSISFKVVATNPQNLANMYSKLNRLAGGTAPSYASDGLFMRGTLASLTIGDLLRNQMGFITSVRLSWQHDYLWELGPVISSQNPGIRQAIKDMYGMARVAVQDGFEGEYYRVPQLLDVSLNFTPIEHGTVREDYNAYFVFDPEGTASLETHSTSDRNKEANLTLKNPFGHSGDMWFTYDSDGRFVSGGMNSDRSRGLDPYTRRPFEDR